MFVFSNLQSEKNHQVSGGGLSVSCTPVETASVSSAKHNTAETKTSLDSRTNKPTHRPRKTDSGEICLSSKRMTDVDHVHVTEEKRKQMMKKARAISRAISKKAASSKNSLSVTPSFEHSHSVDMSPYESTSRSNSVQSVVKSGVMLNDGWRIPCLRNVRTVTGSDEAGATQPSPASEVAPPLSKGACSGLGLRSPGHNAGQSRKLGQEMLHHSFANHWAVGDNKTNTSMVNFSPMPLAVSSERVKPDVVEDKTVDGLKVNGTSEVPAEMPQTAAGLLSPCDSSSNLLHVSSRELREKIRSSSLQKSTVLHPNAVPAHRERDTAVSILVPSQQKSLQLSTARPESPVKITSTSNTVPVVVVVNASISSSPHISPAQSTTAKKRKLNISQYKSILPQRQRMLPQLAAVTLPAQPPNACVYGRYKDILHDHDYVSDHVKHGNECIKESSIEQTSVSCKKIIGNEIATVANEHSGVIVTPPTTTESMQDETNSDTASVQSVTEDVSVNVALCVVSSVLKPVKPSVSAAHEFRPELDLKPKVTTIIAPTSSVEDETVDRLPAYFDVVSLPNRQTKISVSAETLTTKKKLNPQSCIINSDRDYTEQLSKESSDKSQSCKVDVVHTVESVCCVSPQLDLDVLAASALTERKLSSQSSVTDGDQDSTEPSSKEPSAKPQSCGTGVGHSVESLTAEGPQLDSDVLTVEDHLSSRSRSVSSAISISSDEWSSRSSSRSSCCHRSTSESSYSSHSRSEYFEISFITCFVYSCLVVNVGL